MIIQNISKCSIYLNEDKYIVMKNVYIKNESKNKQEVKCIKKNNRKLRIDEICVNE